MYIIHTTHISNLPLEQLQTKGSRLKFGKLGVLQSTSQDRKHQSWTEFHSSSVLRHSTPASPGGEQGDGSRLTARQNIREVQLQGFRTFQHGLVCGLQDRPTEVLQQAAISEATLLLGQWELYGIKLYWHQHP